MCTGEHSHAEWTLWHDSDHLDSWHLQSSPPNAGTKQVQPCGSAWWSGVCSETHASKDIVILVDGIPEQNIYYHKIVQKWSCCSNEHSKNVFSV